ncbi:AIM24 family protein [Pseudonocardia sp. C8]|uniref:AIM24 family protein n=1 Tax=Pseudonocardia sp. C8 TaxID=2762759 RepID=UPI0016424451|nr:AIM24 family protein [Pseudonocardia sp. C8]MBC3192819.1 AIM24 family protein [Pseudonocardia sp. C8]
MRSNLFAPENQEQESAQPGLRLQNSKMLKVELNGEVLARQGSMVAYQGDVRFEALGAGGIGRFIKQQLTGEGVPLMKLKGRGDVFLADAAADVHVIDLEGPDDTLTINGKNVLAFEPTLSYDVRMTSGAGSVGGAGLFNCVFRGRGRLAITAKGAPVVLNVDAPTYADPQAAIAWSAGLQVGLHRAEQLGVGTLLGRTTGERYTMTFSGQGFVIVQASEEVPANAIAGNGSGEQSGVGGLLGGFLK